MYIYGYLVKDPGSSVSIVFRLWAGRPGFD
jgi:hypothetical protein